MKKHFLKTIIGFTLAEVLITLTVIGVIAALTIPSLIQNIQDQQLRTAWKETYSILNQASSRMLQDNGGNIAGMCSDGDSNCLKNLYVPYLSITKNCPASAVGNCWVSDGSYYFMNGSQINSWNSVWSGISPTGLVLANGAYVVFSHIKSDCSNVQGVVSYCGGMDVDVNGPKGPNMEGKDLFIIWQTKSGVMPQGIQGDLEDTDCNSSQAGWGCGALYLRQ